MRKNIKIVNIIGGLGNQMLQYSFALILRERYPEDDVRIDISHFKGYRLHNGFELDRIFNVELQPAKWWQIARVSRWIPVYKLSRGVRHFFPRKKTECVESPIFEYQKAYLEKKGSVYYEGYWHYAKMLQDYRNILLKSFRFPDIDDEQNNNVMQRMKNSESVAIHIRRGDYVGAPAFSGICTEAYYSKAIEKIIGICGKPSFFIFSNDINFSRRLFARYENNYELTYISWNVGQNSYRDMQLMTYAKANIIANSSFSWWGAWLGCRENHIVICPSRWVNYSDSKDMIPEEWIKIEV